MDPQFVLIPVMAAAGLVQAVSGFGSALVAMPILAQLLGTRTASPVFALAAIIGEAVMILRYRRSLTIASVWRLMISTVIAIPIGIFGAPFLDERLLLFLLGLLVFAFAVYALTTPNVPRLRDPRWGFVFGFASGLLSGAFNTGGPPYVIYGTTQGWVPKEFKANLQGVFIAGSLTLIISHFVKGNLTREVTDLALFAIPALLAGIWLGFSLDRHVDPVLFRKGIQVLLLILGLTLMF